MTATTSRGYARPPESVTEHVEDRLGLMSMVQTVRSLAQAASSQS